MEEVKERIEKVKQTVKQKMGFKELIEVLRGNTDIEQRASVILNPKMPETSTNLNANQVDFVGIGKTMQIYFPEFKPLEVFTEELLLVSESKDGWGVESMIRHEQAVNEKRWLELGLGKERGVTSTKAKS